MVLFGSDDFNFDANPIPGPGPSGKQLERNENTSDFDESSDGDNNQLDLNTDLIGVNRTTKDLNIVNTYRPRWTCKEAFRESYQNWRDGILKSFNLKLSQLRPTYTENKTKRLILIEAHHPETKELLGFIQFKHDKDGYCVGGLRIVNFKATLKYRNLGTGATTKAYDDGQTGQHGDGMKISALVYRRNNYNVRYESSSFKWRFLYKKGSLACSLTRINETILKQMMKKARGQPRTHNSHPWEDVCLIVGAPGPTRDIYGRRKPGERLSITDFKRWITVTLDIDPPQNIIHTSHGDLIRDPKYRGHMYLRGLLLPRGGTRGNNYKYGYNFVEGSTSSDRDALTGGGEESEGISAIWTAAIRTDQSTDSELVSDYTELLLSSINKMGDVMLHIDDGEDELMPGDIARQVWAKMLTLNTDGDNRAAFYYSAAEGKDVS
ncbi:uncharacterized protein J4E79_002355 [Alternaria viburni]|uniref:uncharacterized protein n=1 Tax=Alternaria viburni TaxID=566460 RepID=UPI0020C25A1D|nr:uncharacterized protein J4E79_002355 [Alternaria viburni]KAI4666318.1 hypothetical protein J4E79_002355 [Alternaria viburni]